MKPDEIDTTRSDWITCCSGDTRQALLDWLNAMYRPEDFITLPCKDSDGRITEIYAPGLDQVEIRNCRNYCSGYKDGKLDAQIKHTEEKLG